MVECKEVVDKLPNEYKSELNDIVNKAIVIFGDNLINITLGGSAGKNNVIPNWSDLDLYIILERYDVEQVITFMKIVSKMPIHVGTTFYTSYEVENNVIDNKTKVMLYEMQNYPVNPILYGENIFNKIDYSFVKENDINNFPNILHDFRRRFIELCSGKELDKTYIKKLLVLIKCYLSHYNIFSYGYKETFDKLFEVLDSKGLTVPNDFDIISVIKNIDGSRNDVIVFSKRIIEIMEKDCVLKGDRKWIKELVQEQ